MWFRNRSDTNPAVQAQKMARGWKFWTYKVQELYYPCSENKGADQLHSCCEADNYEPLFSHMQILGFPMWRLIIIYDKCITQLFSFHDKYGLIQSREIHKNRSRNTYTCT